MCGESAAGALLARNRAAQFGDVAFRAALGGEPCDPRLEDHAHFEPAQSRLAEVECLDMAMLLRSLRARVISRGARNYRAYADLAVGCEERDWRSNGTWNRVQRMPAGPAAVITPWNAPFMLSTWSSTVAPLLSGVLLTVILILGVANFNVLITSATDTMTIVLPLILFGGGVSGCSWRDAQVAQADVYARIGEGHG